MPSSEDLARFVAANTEAMVDEEKRKEIREKLNIGEKFVIGHAGHLASVKNQGFLIEIMPLCFIPAALLFFFGHVHKCSGCFAVFLPLH